MDEDLEEELQHPHTHEPGGRESDPLDEPVLPTLGLSTAVLVAIFVGGGIGTVARYLLGAYHPLAPGAFPWPTLVINLSGSLAIGLLVPFTEHVAHRTPLARPFLVIGFLGGWTTYSTLAVESTLLAKDGDVATCLAYLAATVVGGLTLVVVGDALGRRMAHL
jgi:CrcB protein